MEGRKNRRDWSYLSHFIHILKKPSLLTELDFDSSYMSVKEEKVNSALSVEFVVAATTEEVPLFQHINGRGVAE